MKKFIALLLTLSILFLLAGCDKTAAQQVKTNTDGEYIYYADESGIVKAKSGDEQSETVVSGVDADNITIDGGAVYYRSKSDGKIYSSDGNTVADEQIWSFKLVGETFYCVDMQMNLFSLTKSGEKSQLDTLASNLQTDGESLYYIKSENALSTNRTICSMKLSDKKTAVLTDSKNFTALASSDEGLHYTVSQDDGSFEYLLDTSGGKQDKLLCPSGNCATVCDGYLYYVSDKTLYRSKLYENGQENLGIDCEYITIENGYVFCTSYGESGVNNNSTEKHKISELRAAD